MNIRLVLDNEDVVIKDVKSYEVQINLIDNSAQLVIYMNNTDVTKIRNYPLKDIVAIRTY